MTDNDPHSANRLSPSVLSGLVATAVGAAYGAFLGHGLGYATVGAGVLVGLAMIAVRPTSRVPSSLWPAPCPVRSPQTPSAGPRRPASTTARPSARRSGRSPGSSRSGPSGSCSGISAYVGFGFVNSRVRSVRELLAASSLSPRDETECGDDFAPGRQA